MPYRACRASSPLFGLLLLATSCSGKPSRRRPQAEPKPAAPLKSTARKPARPSATEKPPDPVTLPRVRLLDQLAQAKRNHPELERAYRRLRHARKWVDPWSGLQSTDRFLRLQVGFAYQDVRAYAADNPRDRQRLRPRIGEVRRHKVPGFQQMRRVLFTPAPSLITFTVKVPPRAFLTFGVGVPRASKPGVTFRITAGGRPLWQRQVAARERHAWHDHRVDLKAFAGQSITLTLATQGPRDAVGFWSNPTVYQTGAPRPGKNIVLIVVDTLRADAVGASGGRFGVSPQLDAYAKRGVSFTQCQAISSWTRSTLLSLLSQELVSRVSEKLNHDFWHTPRYVQALYRRWPRLLTRHLERQGYLVEGIGNHFFWPAYSDIGFDSALHRATDLRHVFYGTPAITRGALRFLQANRARPFFLWLHYWGPHKPYVAPKGYRPRSLRGQRAPGAPGDRAFEGYLARTKFTDDQLGLVFGQLKRLGLDKNTIVAVTSDHGEIFHRLHDEIDSGEFRTGHNHGFTAFQEVLHVPLVLVGPGVPAGRSIAHPVSQLDLGPTLLELAGLPQLKGGTARSLVPAWGPGKRLAHRPIASLGRYVYALRHGRWKYAYRIGRTRVFRRPAQPGRSFHVIDELYDLTADPHETRNLAKKHPERVKQMRRTLLGLVRPPGRESPGR